MLSLNSSRLAAAGAGSAQQHPAGPSCRASLIAPRRKLGADGAFGGQWQQHCSRPTLKAGAARTRLPLKLEAASTTEVASVEPPPVQVESLEGIRVAPVPGPDGSKVEYLIKWKDGHAMSWEPTANLAPDLLRDYEHKWWSSVKRADEAAVLGLLAGAGGLSAEVLVNSRDESGRSALHFASAVGSTAVIDLLLRAGASPDVTDKDGYTAMHMAAGYAQPTSVAELLAKGADAEVRDSQGRTVLELAQALLSAVPTDKAEAAPRREGLSTIVAQLQAALFEEVVPQALLDARPAAGGAGREFLVRWADGSEDSWVDEAAVGNDLVADFEAGLEYGEVRAVLDRRTAPGGGVEYLVQWADDPEGVHCWEPAEYLSADDIARYTALNA